MLFSNLIIENILAGSSSLVEALRIRVILPDFTDTGASAPFKVIFIFALSRSPEPGRGIRPKLVDLVFIFTTSFFSNVVVLSLLTIATCPLYSGSMLADCAKQAIDIAIMTVDNKIFFIVVINLIVK